VGIDQYEHAEQIPALRFAARDAEAVAAALADPDVGNFREEQVLLLTGAQATRDEVVRHLSKWLPGAVRSAELVVIYFAGHGMVHRVGLRDEGFLLPYDADPDDLVTRGVAMRDVEHWIGGLDTQAVVVCLDCCHAGKIIPHPGGAPRGAARDLELRPEVIQGIAGKGRFLLASCDEGQKSVESVRHEHGLFTYHLLAGMRGAADRDGNGKVGVAELFEYVAEAVEHDAREQFGRVQRPWHNSAGPGGVFISAPRPGAAAQAATLPGLDRLWHQDGPAAAVQEMERRLAGADEAALVAMLRFLERRKDPAAVPVLFRCLVHASEAVRVQAMRAVKAVRWEKTAAAVEALARTGDEGRLDVVLEGLAALEAHAEVVALLDRLAVVLKGNFRNRAILLLERKRLGLGRAEISALFEQKGSPYRIQRVLGQGLCTAAYLARHEVTGLDVVVRVLRPEFANQPHVRGQFLDLSSRSMHFVHQNLVVTRDVMAFSEQNVYYAVRDYVDGVTLQQVLQRGRTFDPLQVLKIVRALLKALTPLHREAAFHGGIKPSNIFLCGDDRVILGDPSLAVQGAVVAFERLSYDYRYAAPEMFRSGCVSGPSSDFYALGCVAYELLAGQPPFVSDNHFELVIKHDREPVPPLTRYGAGPAAADGLVQRLLAKSPEGRFANLDEALAALEQLRQKLQRPPTPPGPRPTSPEIASPVATLPPEPMSVPVIREASLIQYDAPVSIVPFTGAGPGTVSEGGQSASAGSLRQTADVARRSAYLSRSRTPVAVPGYEVLEQIGRGSTGVVYKARELSLNRLVALKVLVHPSPEHLRRFHQEAIAVARLQHPNIVQIYQIGETDDPPFLSLELCEGGSLAQVLDGTPWLPGRAAALVEMLACAMQVAHAAGIIHRDLKPGNVLLTGDPPVPKVTDFGLAKQLAADVEQTMTGAVMGTPPYMAPEQAAGETDRIGPWTDVYGLGAILYELLTGRSPFKGATAAETLDQVRTQDPVPPSRLLRKIPRDLETICLKCLVKHPEDRYASAKLLADDLAHFLAGEPITARPLSALQRLTRWIWRPRHRF
jgi:serine/threonine protein kinase